MPVSTASVLCNLTAYTVLTSGHSYALVKAETDQLRIYIGASLPAADTTNYWPLKAGEELPIEGLDGAEVYARCERKATGRARLVLE